MKKLITLMLVLALALTGILVTNTTQTINAQKKKNKKTYTVIYQTKMGHFYNLRKQKRKVIILKPSKHYFNKNKRWTKGPSGWIAKRKKHIVFRGFKIQTKTKYLKVLTPNW